MKARIVDVTTQDVQAAAQFEYKGWTISMSSIMHKGRVEVLAWKDKDLSFNTVEDAIDYIDSTLTQVLVTKVKVNLRE